MARPKGRLFMTGRIIRPIWIRRFRPVDACLRQARFLQKPSHSLRKDWAYAKTGAGHFESQAQTSEADS